MTPSIVTVRDDGIAIKPGAVDAPARGFPDMASAAAYLAVASHVEGVYLFDRSCADRRNGNRFDVVAFADLVDEALADLRASNGWRIRATAGEHTIWARPGIDDIGETYDTVFAATKGEVPETARGFHRLPSVLRAKGLSQEDLVPAEGASASVRAVRGTDGAGGAAWTALHLEGDAWSTVRDADGMAIDYGDADAARAGALAALEQGSPDPGSPTPRF
jgi:hypothetical protein